MSGGRITLLCRINSVCGGCVHERELMACIYFGFLMPHLLHKPVFSPLICQAGENVSGLVQIFVCL